MIEQILMEVSVGFKHMMVQAKRVAGAGVVLAAALPGVHHVLPAAPSHPLAAQRSSLSSVGGIAQHLTQRVSHAFARPGTSSIRIAGPGTPSSHLVVQVPARVSLPHVRQAFAPLETPALGWLLGALFLLASLVALFHRWRGSGQQVRTEAASGADAPERAGLLASLVRWFRRAIQTVRREWAAFRALWKEETARYERQWGQQLAGR